MHANAIPSWACEPVVCLYVAVSGRGVPLLAREGRARGAGLRPWHLHPGPDLVCDSGPPVLHRWKSVERGRRGRAEEEPETSLVEQRVVPWCGDVGWTGWAGADLPPPVSRPEPSSPSRRPRQIYMEATETITAGRRFRIPKPHGPLKPPVFLSPIVLRPCGPRHTTSNRARQKTTTPAP